MSILTCVQEPIYTDLQMKMSLLMSPLLFHGSFAYGAVISSTAVPGGWRPLLVSACAMLRRARGSPSPPQAESGADLPSALLNSAARTHRRWDSTGQVTQKRHQQRPKGEAAKQRASEQPIFTLSPCEGLHEDMVLTKQESCQLMARIMRVVE